MQLRYKCTFNFATSVARQRKQRERSGTKACSAVSVNSSFKSGLDVGSDQQQRLDHPETSNFVDAPDSPIQASSSRLEESWLGGSFRHEVNDTDCAEYAADTPQRFNGARCVDAQVSNVPCSALEVFSPGAWHGSPMHLLNSTTTRLLLSAQLDQIHKAVLADTVSRYLAYRCNIFAGCYKYKLNAEACQELLECSARGVDIAIPRPDVPKNLSMSSSLDDAWKATLIGVARFLDNFGSFYGNRLSLGALERSEHVLVASVQSFALQ